MDRIALGSSGRQTTRLGFGSSSLMGAMGRRDSLAMLESAFDAGIRHFDVAPMYGYGEAEGCLGEFLQRHPGDVTVATKYGIPPAKNSSLMGTARGVVRPLLKRLPGLKQRLVGVARTTTRKGEKASFTAAQAKASLDRSLAALRCSRIDVWLLHEVEAADLQDDGLLRLLEDEILRGTIGTFGVGSESGKIGELLNARPAYCRVLQYEWSVLDAPVPAGAPFRIHHRSLTQNFRSLHERLTKKTAICRRWSEQIGIDLSERELLANLMLKAALVMNPASVILFSSKDSRHIQENVRVAGDASIEAPARKLYELIQTERDQLLSDPEDGTR
ncbi:MAG: aldo/keto reductase [Edaphobacter sp.]|uniref:aldo/keto reductase n=1 Tax=Edaphobacter sp. TaxID=1934404 RepID=UPI00298184A0|nr:aldo/keto reductase [Edaphobacter sp.]MDW5266591.1 aldo/keto reductase [Edaphobacter sp.]